VGAGAVRLRERVVSTPPIVKSASILNLVEISSL